MARSQLRRSKRAKEFAKSDQRRDPAVTSIRDTGNNHSVEIPTWDQLAHDRTQAYRTAALAIARQFADDMRQLFCGREGHSRARMPAPAAARGCLARIAILRMSGRHRGRQRASRPMRTKRAGVIEARKRMAAAFRRTDTVAPRSPSRHTRGCRPLHHEARLARLILKIPVGPQSSRGR